MKEKLKAVAYARYSTDMQTENSIAYQLDAIKKYCNEHGILLSGVYKDEAMSGTNTNRPGFQSMLADAKRHLFNAVVIYDISRGSRNVADWFEFRNEMALLNVKVISANQELGDVLDPNNFLVELINVGLGQHMVLDTRKKSIAGTCARAREGIFCGGIPPLGYDIVDGKYVINPAEANIVRKIFELYANGKSYSDIINAIGNVTGRRGRPLGKNSLYSILNNERYIGVYTWNKRITKVMGKWAGGKPNPNMVRIEDRIPAIIDNETWRKAAKRMRDNKRNAINKAKRDYLLSGLIECEECGSTYIGHTSTNKKGYKTSYYMCGNKYRTHTCHAKNINANELETFVVYQVRNYLRTIDFDEMAQKICDDVNNSSADLSAERRELRQIETKINNGVKAVLSGLDIPELSDEIDRLRVRKSELEDIISYNEQNKQELDKDTVVEMLREAKFNCGSNDKAAINTLVTKIYAHADGSATVNIGVHITGCGVVFIPFFLRRSKVF